MFEQAFRNIDDVLWKEAGCTTELDYTEQTSWLLFLKYLDGLEQDKAADRAGVVTEVCYTAVAGRAPLEPHEMRFSRGSFRRGPKISWRNGSIFS